MSTYAMSDIHGEYELFLRMLEKIKLKEEDLLYILGDVLDRGPHPVKLVLKLMEMPNIILLAGNHELMALNCLEFLMQEITDDSIEQMNEKMIGALSDWTLNGAQSTIKEFRALDSVQKKEVIEFLKDTSIYEEVSAAGKEYLLVHAGLADGSKGDDIEAYSLKNLLWDRAAYEITYFQDKYVISGHTPTQYIADNPKPGYIYKGNHHIAIDCGCSMPDGRLAAYCLETGQEFYTE
ncbi:MAG: fructose-bisphosphatase class III [Lachnospiraceae bacterium]|nr:fructose-bisphosphatase class III [Lachnospiraceae bacterium]